MVVDKKHVQQISFFTEDCCRMTFSILLLTLFARHVIVVATIPYNTNFTLS